MMNKEKQEKLKKKLRELTNAQDSIQSLSAWVMHYREFAPQIVQIWLESLREAEMSHRLSLFYLANDVLQASRKRNYANYVDAFALVLNEATSLARGKEIKHEIERVYSIWEDRLIYSSEFISELRDALEMPIRKTQKIRVKKIAVNEPEVNNYEVDLKTINPDEYTKIITEFKPKTLVSLLRQIEDLEKDSKAKLLGVQDTQFEEPPEKMLKSVKMDQTSYRNFDQQLEECAFYLEEYISALEKEHEHQKMVEEALRHAAIYYTTQAKEARIVVKAYKSFTARVKTVEKKLNKIKPVLLSPVPSPPSDYEGSPSEVKDEDKRSYTPPLPASMLPITPGTGSSSQTSVFVEPDTTVPHTIATPTTTREINVASCSTSDNFASHSSTSSPNSHQSTFLAPDSTSIEIVSTPDDVSTNLPSSSVGDSALVPYTLSPPSVLPLLSPPSPQAPSGIPSTSSAPLPQPPSSPASLPAPPLPAATTAAPPPLPSLPKPFAPLTTLPPLPTTGPPAPPPAPLSSFEASCLEIPLPPSPSQSILSPVSSAVSQTQNFGKLPPPPPLCSSLSANGSTTQSIVSPIMSNISGLPPAAFGPSSGMMGSFNYPGQYGFYSAAAAFAASYASYATMQAAHTPSSSNYNTPISTSEVGLAQSSTNLTGSGTNTPTSSSATLSGSAAPSHLPSDDKSGIDDDMELDDSEEESGGVIEIFSGEKQAEMPPALQQAEEIEVKSDPPLLVDKLGSEADESVGTDDKHPPHNAMAVGSILDTLDALDREFNATFKKDTYTISNSSNIPSSKLSVLDTLDELDKEFNATNKKDKIKNTTLSTPNIQSDQALSSNIPPKIEPSIFQKALKIPGIDDLLKTISSSPILLKAKPEIGATNTQANDLNFSDSNSSFASASSSVKAPEQSSKPLSPPPLPLSLGDFSSFLHKSQGTPSPVLASSFASVPQSINPLKFPEDNIHPKGKDTFLLESSTILPIDKDLKKCKSYQAPHALPPETILDSIDMEVSNNSNLSHCSYEAKNENSLGTNNAISSKADFESKLSFQDRFNPKDDSAKSESSFDIYHLDESQDNGSHPSKAPPLITNLNKEYDSNATSDNAFSYANSPSAKVSLPQSGFSFKDHFKPPSKENLGDEYESFCSQINTAPEYGHETHSKMEDFKIQGTSPILHEASSPRWPNPSSTNKGSMNSPQDPKFYEDDMNMGDTEPHLNRTDFNKTQFCSPPMPNLSIQMPSHFGPYGSNRTPRPHFNRSWTSNARRPYDRNFSRSTNPRHHYY